MYAPPLPASRALKMVSGAAPAPLAAPILRRIMCWAVWRGDLARHNALTTLPRGVSQGETIIALMGDSWCRQQARRRRVGCRHSLAFHST
ncbi:hypothetical protein E2C01_017470 [Portunus trituberculatus]|uniref:Uncharacterized protein n=1 Tax=Portunus trituberculatus TaxID=210409 RepID=A0A5B7DTJ3_PORTR|nr:hypothetical protein [Portunus trituberculatus]